MKNIDRRRYQIVYEDPPFINLRDKRRNVKKEYILGLSRKYGNWVDERFNVNEKKAHRKILHYIRRHPYLKSDLALCVLQGSEMARIILQRVINISKEKI